MLSCRNCSLALSRAASCMAELLRALGVVFLGLAAAISTPIPGRMSPARSPFAPPIFLLLPRIAPVMPEATAAAAIADCTAYTIPMISIADYLFIPLFLFLARLMPCSSGLGCCILSPAFFIAAAKLFSLNSILQSRHILRSRSA